VKENMAKLDKGAIKHICSLDPEGFLDYINKTGATICGQYPIATLLELSKLLGAKKAELLKYYTSGDVIGDYSSAVGYASIKIE
jgi:AmmeMemoRadiSam system protein B